MRPCPNCETGPMKLRAALLAFLLVAVTAAVADTQEAELFRPAEQARAQAEDAEAALLAPAGYGAGVAALERARRGYRGGAGIDDVGGLLDQARASLGEAARNAAEARETFTAVLGKRDSARAVEAFRLATGSWAEAEELLQGAARRLEGSDVEGALRRAADAQRLYDTAELQAIK